MLLANTFRLCLCATVLTCAISTAQFSLAQEKPSQSASSDDYRIEPEDVLQIDVWRQPEITRTIPVQPNGNITLPFINEVKAAGLSAVELATLIREKLKNTIPNPQVTLMVIPKGTNIPPSRPPQLPILPSYPLSPDLKQPCCAA
jgi:protein involved in polysaccharide export with SLBB domain